MDPRVQGLLNQPALARLAEWSASAEFEGQLWVVGGAVRDALLARHNPGDFDLVREGDVMDLTTQLYEAGISSIFPVQYPRFGTARVQIADTAIEFVSARGESYEEHSRKPHVRPATLRDDVYRRDFTCNSLLLNLHTGEVRDETGQGLSDIEAGILRTPLDPRQTMIDDPLRILRTVRFATQLGFSYAPGLAETVQEEASQLAHISQERIRDEFVKIVLDPRATFGLREMMRLGICDVVLPEFVAMLGVEQGSFHHLDVWEHSLAVLDHANQGNLRDNLAALFHDIAKPQTRTVDPDGRVRFFGHEVEGAKLTAQILRRLKFPGDLISDVCTLVRNHMRLGTAHSFSIVAARRLVRDLDALVDPLLHLVEADIHGCKPGAPKVQLGPIRDQIARVQIETPAALLRSPIDGREVMEILDIPPGKAVGEALHWLSEQVIEGTLDAHDQASAREKLRFEYRPGTL